MFLKSLTFGACNKLLNVCWRFVLLAGMTNPVLGANPPDIVGTNGWIFEQFGYDVSVLRASSSRSSGQASNVGILISCSGEDRRLRLSLPVMIATAQTAGHAAITTFDQPDSRTYAIVRFTLRTQSEIVVSETSGTERDIAVIIGQMLLTKPHALDIVVSLGPNPVLLTQLKAYRLFISLGPADIDAVERFIQSCGRPAIRPLH